SLSRCMSIRPRALSFAVATLAFAAGCGRLQYAPLWTDAGAPYDATTDVDVSAYELLGAPLVFSPTATSFGLSVVLRDGAPAALRARVRDDSSATWSPLRLPTLPASDAAEWSITDLEPGRRYA